MISRIVHPLSSAIPQSLCQNDKEIHRGEKIKHTKNHKSLTRKFLFGIRLSVTKITVFETNKGIGERSREALGESKGRAVCTCY